MAWMRPLKPAAAALAVMQLRCAPSSSAAAAATPALLIRRHVATSSTARPRSGDGDSDGRGGERVVDNPPPEMAPLPEDAPPQTPPRLGEPDPAGPPVPPTSKDKIGGGATTTTEGGPGARAPGSLPDTAPPPDVELPPVSPPDGRNV